MRSDELTASNRSLLCKDVSSARDGFLDGCLAVLADVIIIVLKADAVKDEVLDELGLILVNVLLKMQDVCMVLSTMLAKPTADASEDGASDEGSSR